MLAAILLVVPWLIAGVAQDDYDWLSQDVSDLGAGTADHGWIQDSGDTAAGVLLGLFAVGLYSMVGNRWSGRLGVIFIGVVGIVFLLSGFWFDLDCSLADEA